MKMSTAAILLAAFCLCTDSADAALVLNSPLPISRRVTVQPIIVSGSDGASPVEAAEYFGDTAQSDAIMGFVDDIWAQAGIDIEFLTPNSWENDFAFDGSSEPAARPTSDLSTIVAAGDVAGVGNSDPLVLDMYLVNIVPGFSFTTENTANGLAFVPGNGITQFVGTNLLSFNAGREVIASVVAHEIGHNLGLDHVSEAENLLQAGGSPDQGERLNATQLATARGSQFAQVIAVPEPTAIAFLVLASGTILVHRRRNMNAA